MELKIIKAEDKTFAKVFGRINTANAVIFEQLMQPMLTGNNPNIEMDCSALEYISSSGLRLFLTLQKSVTARGGQLVLVNMNDDVRAVFTMTGFVRLFTIR